MLIVVHRHLIGLVFIILGGVVGIVALSALLFVVSPDALNDLSKQSNRALIGGVVFAIAILILVVFVAVYVYRQSRIVLTDQSVVQVLQKSLFSSQISRLSMSNVEDVTGQQKGVLANLFGYGTLIIQTAGEMDNFIFPTCPDPNEVAHEILEARQAYAQSLKEETGVP